jgi:hypothetical protein
VGVVVTELAETPADGVGPAAHAAMPSTSALDATTAPSVRKEREIFMRVAYRGEVKEIEYPC